MNKKLIIVSALALVLPLVSLAYNPPSVPTQHTFSELIDGIIGVLWPLVAAATVIIFFVAAFLFITAGGEAEKIATARTALIYGMVGVIVSIIAVSIPTIIKTLSGLT